MSAHIVSTVRPTILVFIRHYLPGHKFGGPIRTIANMVELLCDEFEFRIVTSDRDVQDTCSYSGINIGEWNRVGNAWVYYVPEGSASLRHWAELISKTPYDVLYFNSLFDSVYTLLPLLARWLIRATGKPLVLAPRGELSPGALSLKRWKKEPYLAIAKILDHPSQALPAP